MSAKRGPLGSEARRELEDRAGQMVSQFKSTRILTPVRARAVRPGDQVDAAGEKLTVRCVESGGNRQVYIATVTEGGAPVVLERDPGEQMSVWRAA